MNFDIPFSEKCNLDYLEVRENDSVGKLIGAFCGNDPLSNVSAIGTMVLIFKSSSDGTANMPQKGFYAEYSVSKSVSVSTQFFFKVEENLKCEYFR